MATRSNWTALTTPGAMATPLRPDRLVTRLARERRWQALGTLVVALLATAGCAGINPYATTPPSAPTDPAPVSVPEMAPDNAPQAAPPTPESVPDQAVTPVAPRPGPAAAHLLAEATSLSARREFDLAAAQIERALRIERDNPWLYLALADIRLAQGDAGQAAVLTRRARSLSRGDPAVLGEAEALALRNPQPGAGP